MSDAGTQFFRWQGLRAADGPLEPRGRREIPRLAGFVERPSLARFGCGNGAFTEVMIARSAPAAVTAIDPSEGQLAYARKRPAASLAQFQQGDAPGLAVRRSKL
jgi:trans-aconitate methyltransferase